MSYVKKAIILSAGFGTRIAPLTKNVPKTLIAINGKPVIEYILENLSFRGIDEVVVNTHYLHEQIENFLLNYETKMKIKISYEKEILETGGGIKRSLTFFEDSVSAIVVNGDIVWNEEKSPFLKELMKNYDASKMDFLLNLSPLKSIPFREKGDVLFVENNDSENCSLIKFPQNNMASNFVYNGIQIVNSSLVSSTTADKFPLKPCWLQAQEKKRLFGCVNIGDWADMGTFQGLEVAKQVLAKRH